MGYDHLIFLIHMEMEFTHLNWIHNDGNVILAEDDYGVTIWSGYDYGSGESVFLPSIDEVLGCTDESSFNYNPQANINDGSCIPFIYGWHRSKCI